MLQLDQMKTEVQQYEDTMHEVLHSLDLEYKKQRIEELQRESEAPDFWSNADIANKKMKQLKDLQTTVEDAEHIETQYEDILMLIEMGNEENDESVVDGVREELDAFENKLEEMRLATLLTGEYDDSNAIMSLNAGAGGTESCDWCSMLYRMYTRWADRKGFKVDVMNFIDGDEAGIKSVDFQISGPNAYGYLKSERGVHRLVRISPFVRHLSFPATLCLISKKILILSLIPMISALIHTVPAVPADSISTRHPRRSVSLTSPPA